mgnify:CR=1 FL=1
MSASKKISLAVVAVAALVALLLVAFGLGRRGGANLPASAGSGPQQIQTPGGAAETTPSAWQYDAANDRHWDPEHGHWHEGPPPGGVQESPVNATTAGQSQAPEAKSKEGKWFTSLSDALAAAQEADNLVLVDAYADWCVWCKKLEKETFSDPKVQAQMKKFILLKIDTDGQPDLARRFGVTGLPTTLVLDAKGKVVLSQPGFMPPEAYLGFLARAEKQAS